MPCDGCMQVPWDCGIAGYGRTRGQTSDRQAYCALVRCDAVLGLVRLCSGWAGEEMRVRMVMLFPGSHYPLAQIQSLLLPSTPHHPTHRLRTRSPTRLQSARCVVYIRASLTTPSTSAVHLSSAHLYIGRRSRPAPTHPAPTRLLHSPMTR